VQAVEIDERLIPLLKDFLSGEESGLLTRVTVIRGNALSVSLPEEPYKVVANIPYQITTPLLRLFLEGNLPAPVSLTLLMQKEVGERLAAKPRTGERGYLSVLTQYFCDVQLVFSVPPRCFWPEPAVDSVVVHLAVKADRPLAGNERAFFDYVKTRFLEPRKQLKNVLAGMRHETSAQVVEELSKLGLPENIRAQELTEADWLKLYNAHV
jgi:16S rRNA (adenine1518-N6/adenine1519-N6)-dimethyltransferase